MPLSYKQKPTGLLLSGGGAKGAFQIGALEVLQERGMLENVTAIAGCSVGSLNMVLYAIAEAGKDYGMPRRIWENLRREDLLSVDNSGTAMFSRDGLVRIMETLPLELVSTSRFQLYASMYNLRSKTTEYHRLNGLPKERIMTLLLASSALPTVYPPVTYQDGLYIDGGMTMDGYLGIPALYAEGHRSLALIVHDSEMSLFGVQNSRFVRRGRTDLTQTFADCDFLLIKPRKALGGILRGTLNFSADAMEQRLCQGRADADAILNGDADTSGDSPEEINQMLVERMQRLFSNAETLQQFVTDYRDSFAVNIPMKTMGGKMWYNDIFAVDGWRLQHHRTVGMQSHYRILDAEGVRQAWVMNPQRLLLALRRFEAEQRLRGIEAKLLLE